MLFTTPTEWVAVLQQLVALFFKPSDEADERLIERVMAPLETWLAECQLARLDTPLPLVVVREIRADQYGIRTAIGLGQHVIKFEIVFGINIL